MDSLRLGKLPARAPVRLVISVTPELHQSLLDYAAVYEETYGSAEPLNELVPAMLGAFLRGDRAFAKRRRGRG